MNENIDNNVAVLAILNNQSYGASSVMQYKPVLDLEKSYCVQDFNNPQDQSETREEVVTTETKGQNIIWTKNATLMLLSLYETKIHMLDNPKKKTKLWISIADELKSLSVEVTPDQVRWKINALTKQYKDCIDNGGGSKLFKYYNEMHQILGQYSNESSTYRLASGVIPQDGDTDKTKNNKSHKTPFRKLRAERRAKVELDKEWIEYLRKQEEEKHLRDKRYERSLRLKQEELELRKKELEIKQTLALKRLQLKEKKQEEILKIEREKCALLRKFLSLSEQQLRS